MTTIGWSANSLKETDLPDTLAEREIGERLLRGRRYCRRLVRSRCSRRYRQHQRREHSIPPNHASILHGESCAGGPST